MILGIDGGGTKTEFLLLSPAGEKISSYLAGSCHYLQIGYSSFKELILTGVRAVLPEGKELADLNFAAVGIPGVGETAQATATLSSILSKIFPCPLEIMNDVKLAWAGSLACQPGICVLAGTGSMSYAVDCQGRDLRCGGWGHAFGDEGSAYWVGREACSLFSQMADGRRQKSLFYELLKSHLKLKNDFELLDYVHDGDDQRRALASLAPILSAAAKQGDQNASGIFRAAARELARATESLLVDFVGPRPVAVSYFGGIFRAGAFFTDMLGDALVHLPVAVKPPQFSPAQGACLHAVNQLGYQPSLLTQFVDNLGRRSARD